MTFALRKIPINTPTSSSDSLSQFTPNPHHHPHHVFTTSKARHFREPRRRRGHRPRQQAAEGRGHRQEGVYATLCFPLTRINFCYQLRLYGAIEAFRQGRLPDNAQIDRALRYVHDNSPVDVSALSPEGQRLVENVRDIVNTSREIVASKNGDELLQSFVWDTRGADLATPAQPG